MYFSKKVEYQSLGGELLLPESHAAGPDFWQETKHEEKQ